MNAKQIAEHIKQLPSEELLELLKNLKKEGVVTEGGCPKGYFKRADTGECIPDLG